MGLDFVHGLLLVTGFTVFALVNGHDYPTLAPSHPPSPSHYHSHISSPPSQPPANHPIHFKPPIHPPGDHDDHHDHHHHHRRHHDHRRRRHHDHRHRHNGGDYSPSPSPYIDYPPPHDQDYSPSPSPLPYDPFDESPSTSPIYNIYPPSHDHDHDHHHGHSPPRPSPIHIPPHHAPTYPSIHPPTHAPKPHAPLMPSPRHPPIHPIVRSFVAVQGVVYCKPCKYLKENTLLGATPIAGATVKLACRNTKYTVVQTATTDKNGYFFVTAPKTVTSYGSHKCKVFLVSSPLAYCKGFFNLNGGISGATLRHAKSYNDSKMNPFALYSVGPLAFIPNECPRPPLI